MKKLFGFILAVGLLTGCREQHVFHTYYKDIDVDTIVDVREDSVHLFFVKDNKDVIKTKYVYKDSKGKAYNVYLSPTGKAYILKRSKTGKVFRQYVPWIGRQINPKAYHNPK